MTCHTEIDFWKGSMWWIFLKLLCTLPPVYPHFHISTFPHFHISSWVDFKNLNSSLLPPTLWYKTYTRFVTSSAPFFNIIFEIFKSNYLCLNLTKNYVRWEINPSPWYAAYMTWVRSEKFVYNREYFN